MDGKCRECAFWEIFDFVNRVCIPCSIGSENIQNECIDCNGDQYFDPDTHSCKYCEPNFELQDENCVECEEDQFYVDYKCYYCPVNEELID